MAVTDTEKASFALTKDISDIGFAALQATFSLSKMRPQFDATMFCSDDVSLGQIVERGLDIISPNFLDNDMYSTLHLGALSPKSIADAAKDGKLPSNERRASRLTLKALSDVMVPAARVQVGKLPSGSYGITELELQLQLKPISIPEDSPVIELRDFELQLFQERMGAALPGDSGNATTSTTTTSVADAAASRPSVSSSITSVYGSATILLGDIDADVKFTYDPSNDAQLARLAVNPVPPSTGRQLIVDVVFPESKPAIGDLINQIVGEVAKLAHEGLFAATLPPPLLKVLDAAALQTIQLTLASEQQESSPWFLSSVYTLIDVSQFLDDINIFGSALAFENPTLTIKVDNPTTAVGSKVCLVLLEADHGVGEKNV